jgi:hypothetical protein
MADNDGGCDTGRSGAASGETAVIMVTLHIKPSFGYPLFDSTPVRSYACSTEHVT